MRLLWAKCYACTKGQEAQIVFHRSSTDRSEARLAEATNSAGTVVSHISHLWVLTDTLESELFGLHQTIQRLVPLSPSQRIVAKRGGGVHVLWYGASVDDLTVIPWGSTELGAPPDSEFDLKSL